MNQSYRTMNIYQFFRIVVRNILLLMLLPLAAGIVMYVATLNQPLEYTSTTTIFTGVTSSSSIENMGSNRVDYFAAQSTYNNLISILSSRSILEEVSLRLLTEHLMLEEDLKGIITARSHAELEEIVPDHVKDLMIPGDFDRSLENMIQFTDMDKNNFIYGIINYDHPHYSLKALSGIKTLRLGSSDIIELSYQANDPEICHRTLEILIDVFLEKYSHLKKNQTDNVVAYFEQQLQRASDKLKDSEARLLEFNTRNEIINYYEQTKHIASQQEKIEIKMQDIQLEHDAAAAVLKKLESEIQSRFKITLRNREILKIRDDLVQINALLASTEVERDRGDPERISEMNRQKNSLEASLKNKIDSLYIYERNSQGVEIERFLGDWLSTVVEYESAGARLIAMSEKKEEFLKLYRKFAPLGARLKRIEREIKVNEEEYLEILHNLGLAKLKQQNEMMANIKVLDAPNLPIDPMPTKRKLFIVVVAFFALIFTLLALFILELLDKRIRSISKLHEYTGLTVAGGFELQEQHSPGFTSLSERSANYLIENLLIHTTNPDRTGPVSIQFFSHWEQEGKSHILEQLAVRLEASGLRCLNICVSGDPTLPSIPGQIIMPLEKMLKVSSYESYLSEHHRETFLGSDYILVEIPAVSKTLQNPSLMKSAAMSYLVVDASRTWSAADNFNLEKLKQILGEKIHSVLNRTSSHDMEELMGEIPRKRSFLRRYIKNKIIKRYI